MTAPVFKGMFDVVLKTMGEAAQAAFTPLSGPPSTDLSVVFLASFQDMDSFGLSFGSPHPAAWIKNGIIDPEVGDSIEINSIPYIIEEVRPASDQYIKLTLRDDS